MFSFFKKVPPAKGGALEQAIRVHLKTADDDELNGVLAIAGLVVKVAMEDADFATEEESFIRAELLKVGSLGQAGVDAIVGVIRAHAKTIAEADDGSYARWLGEKRDRAFCIAVLEMLVHVARAHAGIDARERELLGRVATGMGLTEDDVSRLAAG